MKSLSHDLIVFNIKFQKYIPSFIFQKKCLELRKEGKLPDTLIVVEHFPVFTLGRSANESEIINRDIIIARGAEIVTTDRGGKITFHGPGQLVVYPIIKLKNIFDVDSYVSALEDIMIKLAECYGIKAQRNPINRGIWVNAKKIGAVGVKISQGITMHGFCFNVNVDLTWYSYIIPCGIKNCGVTSLHELLLYYPKLPTVTEDVIKIFSDMFFKKNILIYELSCNSIESIVENEDILNYFILTSLQKI